MKYILLFSFLFLLFSGCIIQDLFVRDRIYYYPEEGFELENNTYIDAIGSFVEFNLEEKPCLGREEYYEDFKKGFDFLCSQGLLFNAYEVDSKISGMPRFMYFENEDDIKKIKNLNYDINGNPVRYNLKGKIVGSKTFSVVLESSDSKIISHHTYYSIEDIEVIKVSSEQYYFKNYTKENFIRNKEITCHYGDNFSNVTTISYKLGKGVDIYHLSNVFVFEVDWNGFEDYNKVILYKNSVCRQYYFYEETKIEFYVCHSGVDNDYDDSKTSFLLSDEEIVIGYVQGNDFRYRTTSFREGSVICFEEFLDLNSFE